MRGDHLTGEGHYFSITGKLSSILFYSRCQHHVTRNRNGVKGMQLLIEQSPNGTCRVGMDVL